MKITAIIYLPIIYIFYSVFSFFFCFLISRISFRGQILLWILIYFLSHCFYIATKCTQNKKKPSMMHNLIVYLFINYLFLNMVFTCDDA
jgi:nitric oxide reductase large subunit